MNKEFIYYSILLVISFFSFSIGISDNALLLQGDEVMHIATVRESIKNNTLLLPDLDGAANYYKPPLLFWLGIASEKLLGASFFSDRLPITLLMTLSSLVFALILKELRLSFYTSIVITGMYLFNLATFKFSRLLMMDGGLLSSIVFFIYFYVLYTTRKNILFLLAAGLVSGISYFYKGPLFLIYTIIFLFTLYGTYIIRFSFNPFVWKGKKYIKGKAKEFSLFSLAAIVPLILWLVVLLVKRRIDLLAYFLIIENAGKFFEENQGEFRIVWGWLLYTIPFGIFIFTVAVKSLLQRATNHKQILGKIFIITSYFFTLFHLLPNRKDPYYVLPAIPFLLLGVALSIDKKTFQSFIPIIRWNILLNLVLALLIGLVALWITESNFYKLSLFLWMLFSLYGGFTFFKYKEQVEYTSLFHYILFMLGIQLLALPSLYLPIIPKDAISEVKGSVCIVSSEPWDGYDFRNYLYGVKIIHSLPEAKSTCDKENYLLIYHTVEDIPPANFVKIKEWKVWNKTMKSVGMKDLLSNKELLYKKAILARNNKQ